MARPPPEVIEPLLAAVDLEALVRENVAVHHAGDQLEAVCPFHRSTRAEGRTLVLDPEAGRVTCHACGFGATAIGWLMYHDGATFAEALAALGQRTGIALDAWLPPAAIEAAARARGELLAEVAAIWRAELDVHPEAGRYLERRGVGAAMRERFGIGFASSDTGAVDGGARNRRRRLWQHGILLRRDRDTFVPRFRERLMFPIRDVDGTVIGFGGRTLGSGSETRGPKYLNSPASASFDKGRVLYGLHETLCVNAAPARLVIVEGYLDVVALAGAGVDGAVATLGTAVTEAHLVAAFEHTTHVTLCLDGDGAGHAAAGRAIDRALSVLREGEVLDVVHLPAGDDPDTFVRAHGAAAFRERLERARSSVSVLLSALADGCDLAELGGRARFGARVLERAASIRSERLRQAVLDRASAAIDYPLALPVVEDATAKGTRS